MSEKAKLINIEITKRCGGVPCGVHGTFTCDCGTATFVKDFYNDLNAMHWAEDFLDLREEFIYRALLGWPTHDRCWHATSRQRALAFIRAAQKGKKA
jgi:hypothetical protein